MAEEEETKTEEAPKKKGKGKLIIIIAVVVVLLGGVGGFLMMSGSEETGEPVKKEIVYELLELGTYVVNLSESTSFLRVTLVVRYNPEVILATGSAKGKAHGGGAAGGSKEPAGPPGLFGSREPIVRDSILTTLSSKRAEEVLSVEGKERLKEELIDAINDALGVEEQGVVDIFFTEFMIQ